MRNTTRMTARTVGQVRLLTVRQAAVELAVTEWVVRTAIWDGALPAVRIGRAVRVRREDLELWRDGCAGRGSVP
jgi:excisionase family DNA binding protein